ncbi:uncharacterized protein LOC106649733 isoform X2 [Trichogramma pretiosum]|uniref:uncharacterized protein LOC106649733 isoform X2 n=1 Tax=Trichogramma pretiosum TaxID=7493 RepID=UPI0006C9BFD8|nr:uncharacterized protein LOC106649733 isoform X2 [Trichogramma pretiosum]
MPAGPAAPRPAELQMDPRSLYQLQRPAEAQPTTAPVTPAGQVQLTQVDVSTQVDLHEGEVPFQRGVTPHYSREDIKEQYCITNRQLDAVEKSGGGIFGCITNRGPSPCSSAAKSSILSACVRSAPSDENLFDAPYPYPHGMRGRHIMYQQIMYQQPYSTYPRNMSRYDSYNEEDENDWYDSSYFRRRPKSICTTPDIKRYQWATEDEESMKLEGPRSILPQQQPLTSALHSQQQTPQTKPKHVSFARSHTLTSFEVPRTKSPPRPHNQERLIDCQPTQTPVNAGNIHLYTQPEPRILVLEKQPKRGTMKAQATQTEIPADGLKGRFPVTLSPRTIHRVRMVSQGAQTNGILNGRTKLTKSYSEAGQLGTPLGGSSSVKENVQEHDHEPLQRTQSEEPPRSPYIVETPPMRSPSKHIESQELNSDLSLTQNESKKIESEEDEILIDFKPAPVSPDARMLLNEMAQPYRRYISLQKTLSDGEIQVERRELIGETGEPSYPHSCRRNHQDPWGRNKLRTPIQFSSTPEDLSLLRIATSPDDYNDEEFHENIVRRGLFRKRSVSLEDGVQAVAINEYILPRSLPTSPTSPTLGEATSKISQSHRGVQRRRLRTGYGIPSPFVSSESLTNDATRDHSDGIWNESQATVLQADSLAALTPASKRRHLLILQHQQRSSMDTDALDAEDELNVYSNSPRIRLEAATPVTTTPSHETYSSPNGKRIEFLRRSPGLQAHSQSSSEFGLSRSGTTDISETSTTDDYITANTSMGTGTTTGSRPYLPAAISTASAADGSSFESASSVYSLARSELNQAILDEPHSSHASKDKSDSSYSAQPGPSPLRTSSSSSSGSYDVEDAQADLAQEAYKTAHPTTGIEPEIDDGQQSSSGGYAESPPDREVWTEDERRRRRRTFTPPDYQDSQTAETNEPNRSSTIDPSLHHLPVDISTSPSRRQRARRSPHRNNKQQSRQTTVTTQLHQSMEEPGHVPTSDDSSCGHHYHVHHHHQHHHVHAESQPPTTQSQAQPQQQASLARHRRARESPRRKSSSHNVGRRRSTEDKNADLTGSLPRRRSRVSDTSRLSLDGSGRQITSTGRDNDLLTGTLKSSNSKILAKAISAESVRTDSPGSDSVFYTIDEPITDQIHCHHCGREVIEDIVQPPASFADSPDGGYRTLPKHTPGQRLFKKFDKRYRSEDRSEKRQHRSSFGSRCDVRAKSEERGSKISSKYDDFSRRRLQARSTDASMEILTGREDEDAYIEPYSSGEWIYIGDLQESYVWRRLNSKDCDEDLEYFKDRRGSQESTESERNFRKKYQAATHRMVHRKSSGEMYKRIQTKCFESDKTVVVRREAGGEFGFRIHGSKPVVVSAIEPDTPAESSGLEVGDIVMSVNGKSVMEATHSEVVRLAHSGSDVLELEVARTCNVLAPQMPGQKEAKQESAFCQGYLWRKSKSANNASLSSSHDKWIRRWFALRHDNCLYYYKTETDSQPIGAVMLLKYDVEFTRESQKYSFAIKKHNAPTLHLAADSEEASVRWVTAIREAVQRNNEADTWLDSSLQLQHVPATMIQRADCCGYLSKQHERVRRSSSPTGWSRRYCVLKDAALYFYDEVNAEQAFGVACLHGFRVHGSAPTSGGRKHAFELQPPDPTQRIYTFAADSEMDKKRWLAALEYSIDRWIKIG